MIKGRKSHFCSLVHNQKTFVSLILAALLGALFLFVATPAKAQDAVWSATLTVGSTGYKFHGSLTSVGCNSLTNCNSALTDNSFDVGGTTYTLSGIGYYTAPASVAGRLDLVFVQTINDDLKALNLCVGSSAFALSGAASHTVTLTNANLGWSAGDTVKLSIGSSCAPPYTLSVDATPPCGSEVTDTSVEPTHTLVLTPAPNMDVEAEYRVIANNAPQTGWLSANSITTSGRSTTSTSGRLAGLRNAYPGFNGFEYRLANDHSVTAQCFWTFREDPVQPPPPPPPPPPPIPTPPAPTGGGPSPEVPSDPAPDSPLCGESDREDLVGFYEASGGKDWHEKENWNSEEPLGEWHGVETNEDGNVVSLRLPDNNLSGDMPTRELLCLKEQLVELALWGNDDLSGEVPEELVLAVERAVLRDIAETLNINPQWFENYGDPYDFEAWHEGVTTDDDGRVTGLDFTEEGVIEGEVPENIFELLPSLGEIMVTRSSGDGGCAVGGSSERMGASALLAAIFMLLALSRGLRARSD